MTIKTQEGVENVASNALGNTAVTLGAIGTGLGILNGGLGLFGGNGMMGNRQSNNDPGANFVTRHELDLIQQLQAKDIQLASKDSEIALQKANQYTDQKIVDTYTVIQQRANELAAEIRANKDAQQAVNAQQMAYNATVNTQVATMANQIANQQAQLSQITVNVVPSNRVCDTGCCCNN